MRKIILLDDYFPTGELTVQPVLLYGPGRGQQDLSRITKTASEALDFIKNVTPEPGKTHLLVLALGGEETYGPNRNGDGFPERPVPARHKTAADGRKWYVEPGEELTEHYKSFETNPAHAFQHHQNKDPAKASGVCKKAFWNDRMHRVELLIVIDNEKDPEWVQRVNDGDFPPVSMGCRIKKDVCSICGNEAPTRAQYCDHAKFHMNEILPDGRKCYVHNPSPSFFDISRVFRPADRNGYTLKKVASVYEVQSSAALGEAADDLERKNAAIRKLSDIDKVIRGEPVASSSNLSPKEQVLIKNFRDYAEPRLTGAPNLPMAELQKHSAATVLSTLSSMGILMKDAEFLEFMTTKMAGRPLRVSQTVLDKTAALVPAVLELFAASPALCDAVLATGALNEAREKVSADLAEVLEPWREKRAYAGEMLYRRLVPEGVGLRPDEAPTTDLLSYTDPRTGETLRTTRGAAVEAQDAVTNAHIRKMLGGGALLLGGYKLLTMNPSLNAFKLPLAVGTGALGYKLLSKRPGGPNLRTNEGYEIPQITEFAPKTASVSLSPIVVNLVESNRHLGQTKVASMLTRASTLLALKNAGAVDAVRGLELDMDEVADVLGGQVLA